jgi:hypothetical protein
MARQSKGSQRQSKGGRSGVQGYFRSAVKRGAAKGQMQAYGRSVNAITVVGQRVEVTTINNVPKSQRREAMEHWNLVQDVLKAKNPQDKAKAEKALGRYGKSHGATGGVNSQEFAYDVDDIIDAYQADPDAFADENRYPKES